MRFLPKHLDTMPLTSSALEGVSIGLNKCATKLYNFLEVSSLKRASISSEINNPLIHEVFAKKFRHNAINKPCFRRSLYWVKQMCNKTQCEY